MAGCGGGGGGPQSVPTPTVFPSTGNRIAWISDRDGAFHLYVMNGDGTAQVRLTQNAGLERTPSWSKDGTRLVLSYSPTNSLADAEIYSIKSDGTGLTRLTNNDIEDNAPVFSPDGQYIAWTQIPNRRSSVLFVARSDGSGAVQISVAGEFAQNPSFDPQGRLVYSSKNVTEDGPSARYQIVRVNRDGSNRTRLSSTSSNLYSPSVSPDGGTLLFLDDASRDFQIYTSPIGSFTPTLLPVSQAGDSDPGWTPDGQITFTSSRAGNSEIYIVNRDGSSLRRLTNNPSTDRYPAAIGPSIK